MTKKEVLRSHVIFRRIICLCLKEFCLQHKCGTHDSGKEKTDEEKRTIED